MKMKQIHTLLNSEGDILSILKNVMNELFIMSNTNNGLSQIICHTNSFNIELYLKSRITLQQLFLLSESEHYIIKTGNEAEAKFFEIDSNNIPPEITGISYGSELFHLIPKSSRTEKTTSKILKMLPAVDDGVKLFVDRDITLTESQVEFFSDNCPIKLFQVESEIYNPSEFDYLSVPLKNGTDSLLCRLSPQLLKLYLTNRISLIDLFKCQSDKEYYHSNDNVIYKLFYTDGLEGFIDKLIFGDLTYYSLPSEYVIENPMEIWDYYVKNVVISGHGVLPSDFEKEYPIEIQIR